MENFIYMFEFVIDDLLITRQNLCAPEEYPTCCEITFRSSVFVSICDREYGTCVDPCQPNCGKCCLFALESPISDKDRLHVHVYKKRNENCKFLIGVSELPVKPLFDRVNEMFNVENANWEKVLQHHIQTLPKMKQSHKAPMDNCKCYEKGMSRREQLCATSELSKRLLPLFNLCKMQTGNVVLIVRLVCNGPSLVSTFPFKRVCSRNPKCSDSNQPPCPPTCSSCGKITKGDNGNGGGSPDGGKSKPGCKGGRSSPPKCVQPDPCEKPDDTRNKCLRYFACNLDKLCPCDYCEDEFDRACPVVATSKPKKSPIENMIDPCDPCAGIPPAPKGTQTANAGKGRQGGGGAGRACCKPPTGCGASGTQKCVSPCGRKYKECCDDARQRAILKLRHLLVKYNINID